MSYPPRYREELARLPALDAKTVIEVLGPRPTSAELRAVGREGADALARLHEEIRSGRIAKRPIMVSGRVLADWLGLDEVARLLREGAARSQRRGDAPK